jgi:hypothetical protein
VKFFTSSQGTQAGFCDEKTKQGGREREDPMREFYPVMRQPAAQNAYYAPEDQKNGLASAMLKKFPGRTGL